MGLGGSAVGVNPCGGADEIFLSDQRLVSMFEGDTTGITKCVFSCFSSGTQPRPERDVFPVTFQSVIA